MNRSPRIGFTLVELLVVIAIIGVLIALLLPAVQAARESARRMNCSSNMKNVALAMHNYHDTCKKFPPGGIGDTNNTWGMFIWPFVEQQAIYNQYRFDLTYNNAANSLLLNNLRISAYCCPSDGKILCTYTANNHSFYDHNFLVCAGNTGVMDPGAGVADGPGSAKNPDGTAWVYRLGTTSTVGGSEPNIHRKAVFAVNKYRNTTDANSRWCPAFGMNDIQDGTSNTMFISEGVQGQYSGGINDLRGLIWWGSATFFTTYNTPNSKNPDRGHSFYNATSLDPVRFSVASGGLTGYAPDGTTTVTAYVIAARSYHPMGVNIALADASIQFKTNSISEMIWRGLSTTQGGENVEEE